MAALATAGSADKRSSVATTDIFNVMSNVVNVGHVVDFNLLISDV